MFSVLLPCRSYRAQYSYCCLWLFREGILSLCNAVFQCGRNILRGIIVKKEEGSFIEVLRQDNYENVIPIAHSLEEATAYLKKLYCSPEGIFTAYYFRLKEEK